MTIVREKLNAFLDQAPRRPFVWGQSDCMLEAADWIDFACGTHAADAWRGRYSSETEAQALMPDGLEAAMRREAAKLGLVETSALQYGDIGIVVMEGQADPVGAILMPSGRWRMKTLDGIVLTRSVTVLVAWSLPCRPSSA